MNPDQAWIGKVLFAGIVGLVIWGATALLQAKSEVARRVRVVIAGFMVLAFTSAIFAAYGPGGVITVGALIGIVIWIVKGRGK